MVKFLAQATCGLDVTYYSSEPSPFTDVPDDSAYKEFVNWAYAAGVITGYEDGTFKPENSITREEVCATLMRFLDFYTAFKARTAADIAFADRDYFSDWAKDYIESLARQGIVNGIPTEDGGVAFMPKKGMMNAEIAAILYRILSA